MDDGNGTVSKPYMVCTDQEMDDRRDALWAEIDKAVEQSASQTDAISEIWKDGFFADMSELNCTTDTKGQALHTTLTGEEKVDPRIPVTADNQKTYSYVDAEGKNISRARVMVKLMACRMYMKRIIRRFRQCRKCKLGYLIYAVRQISEADSCAAEGERG